jgi:hypothetical protein
MLVVIKAYVRVETALGSYSNKKYRHTNEVSLDGTKEEIIDD